MDPKTLITVAELVYDGLNYASSLFRKKGKTSLGPQPGPGATATTGGRRRKQKAVGVFRSDETKVSLWTSAPALNYFISNPTFLSFSGAAQPHPRYPGHQSLRLAGRTFFTSITCKNSSTAVFGTLAAPNYKLFIHPQTLGSARLWSIAMAFHLYRFRYLRFTYLGNGAEAADDAGMDLAVTLCSDPCYDETSITWSKLCESDNTFVAQARNGFGSLAVSDREESLLYCDYDTSTEADTRDCIQGALIGMRDGATWAGDYERQKGGIYVDYVIDLYDMTGINYYALANHALGHLTEAQRGAIRTALNPQKETDCKTSPRRL